ncbi:hypothetical protein [Haladaptatus sp. DFWS20]|uniref:hypothetical protein n=1 Tax=Haladaptatus sp. DFWS20 TaxID=3403467 RepID=UPI003EBF3B2C
MHVAHARQAVAVVVVCLLVTGSGVVVDVKGAHASDKNRETVGHATASSGVTSDDLQVAFVNCSAVSVRGSAERVAVGTTWYAPDGVATSHFEYGPVSGTTPVLPPNQGETGTVVTSVKVYDDGQETPILSRQHPNATACQQGIDPEGKSNH